MSNENVLMILQDLDVDFKLEVKKDLYTNLMSQLEADSVFLRRMNVMDYSLLLGMHYADRANSYNPVAGINVRSHPILILTPHLILYLIVSSLAWDSEFGRKWPSFLH